MNHFHAPIAESIWDMKYRMKTIDGEPIDQTVEDTWRRVADALAEAEMETSPSNDRAYFADKFYEAMEGFKFLPAGRIIGGAGSDRRVTLFNCYVMGTIPDSMDGIFDMLKEAALTMQQGGGIGYDFSTIRPKGSPVKQVASDASGPLSFMDVWDSMCRTILSAGSRRGAMMATMRCDHPDIEDFIEAKADAARLRMFNLSVLVTDDFMKAVKADQSWFLSHVEPPAKPVIEGEANKMDGSAELRGEGKKYIHKMVKARDLWEKIMRSTYDHAEPGVIFIDRINEANNLNYCETISATNPCGEQPLPPYGACLLGSINLVRFVRYAFKAEMACIDHEELDRVVTLAVRMMDNVNDVSRFPLEAQRAEAKIKRRIGLGVTGLADALAMMCIRYGSEGAAAVTQHILRSIQISAYKASISLAREKGAFPAFELAGYLSPGTHASTLPLDVREGISTYGIRNALLTSIAPTGTISLYAGNVSSGIEPIFAYSYTRKVLQKDGSRTEETVEDYAVKAFRDWCAAAGEDVSDFDESWLPDYFVSAQELTPEEHVRMQAAAQPYIDSSISKTINCPEDIDYERFKEVYMQAYESGCKGCTTYRPNETTGSVLSVEPKLSKKEVDQLCKEVTAYLKRTKPGGPSRVEQLTELKKALAEAGVDRVSEITKAGQAVTIRGAIGIIAGPDEPKLDQSVVEALEDSYGPDTMSAEEAREEGERQLDELTGEDTLPTRPESLQGATYKIKVGDQKAVYLTVNDIEEPDGRRRPFEIFLRSSNPTSDEWMVALARMISAIYRRPHDATFVAHELRRIHSPRSGGFWKDRGFQPSLVAAIGTVLREHGERLGSYVRAPGPERRAHDMRQHAKKTAHANVLAGQLCPSCGQYSMLPEAGCKVCKDCGWSSCN